MTISYEPSLPETHLRVDIAARYRANYGLGPDSGVGMDEVRRHWGLERALTDHLLKSTPEDRWQVFADCYTQLYSEITWLNQNSDEAPIAATYAQWGKLLSAPCRVFEVGSGKAGLLKYLKSLGHDCTATEITPERGSKHTGANDGLKWRTTDGIHLADFEAPRTYDVVISTDVVEHFHPDDLQTHFDHAHRILKPGGRYILTTPHVGCGPHDLSAVFGLDRAECMHLKEYDFIALDRALRHSGFTVSAVFPPFRRVSSVLGYCRESNAYLAYLKFIDLDRILPSRLRRTLRRAMTVLMIPDQIWLSARAI